MRQTLNKLALPFSMGVLASFLIHGILVSVLVVGLPIPDWVSEEPEAIEVELVPPPEKAEEEDQVAGEEKAEEPEPLEKVEKVEEEEKKALGPVLQPEKVLSGNQPAPPPPQTLRPVQKFAEKDAGSGESEDMEALKTAKEDSVSSPEKPMEKQASQEPIMSAPKSAESALEPLTDGAPEAEETTEIKERMASETDNESDVATVAIGDLSRGIRAGELCATELRAQLRNSIPSYWPDLLPAYRLDVGSVLQVRKGAFRANGRWYNLKFRCEVDDAATQVVSFDLDVGAPVPRAEWARRGLPSS
jgi:hypothetical protein